MKLKPWIRVALGAAAISTGSTLWVMREKTVEISAARAPAALETALPGTAAAGTDGTASGSASVPGSSPAPAPAADPAPGAIPSPAAASDAGGDYGLRNEERRALDRYRAAQDPDLRQDALLDLALSNEPEVLPFLLDELLHAAPDRREPLLEAVIQYGSRDAIPTLRALAGQAGSADQRRALLEAADFLALPTYTELRRGGAKLAPAAQRSASE